LLFCQAFFNRFLEVFLFFLKYSRKRAKSQANRGLTGAVLTFTMPPKG